MVRVAAPKSSDKKQPAFRLAKRYIPNELSSMPTITVTIPHAMAVKLEKVTAIKRVNKSKYVRDALGTALKKESIEPSLYDLMKESIGCFDSGVTDLSTNPKYMEGFGLSREESERRKIK